MKRFLVPVLVLAAVLSSACDTIRTLSGRPTAAQLEAKRERILDSLAAVKAEEAARAEAEALEAARADTLPILAALRDMQVPLNGRSKFVARPLPRHYYIITGAYLDPANAERNRKRYADAGHEALILGFRNGFQAVAVAPSDRIADIHEAYMELRRNDFCPATAWILINE